jgi:hypothetical protein
VSHQPERTEKNCLNCGTQIYGRYCHICGQENIVAKQGFWAMIKHFIFDIFHFDGKFFDTLKHLLFRPGVITKEYNEGKRTKYLDPVRMYLFTSAIFFIIFSYFNDIQVHFNTTYLDQSRRKELLYDLTQQQAINPNDSIIKKQMSLLKDSALIIFLDSNNKNTTTENQVMYRGVKYNLLYDSSRKFLVGNEVNAGDGWLKRHLKMRQKAIETKYSSNPSEAISQLGQIFIHKLPYLLFISLPFFAGILMLLYSRRKKYYFSDHAIFALHHYIISFILMLIVTILGSIERSTGLNFIGYVMVAFGIIWAVYLFMEMKRFYGQGVLKTFIKFVLLNLIAFIGISILFAIFLIFSIFQL